MSEITEKFDTIKKLLKHISPSLKHDYECMEQVKSVIQLIDQLNTTNIIAQGVSHAYLTKMVKCFPRELKNNFQGVYALDEVEIEEINSRSDISEWFIVINLATKKALHNGKIGHYILFFHKNNKYFYVDPLGKDPKSLYILSQLACTEKKCYKASSSTEAGSEKCNSVSAKSVSIRAT